MSRPRGSATHYSPTVYTVDMYQNPSSTAANQATYEDDATVDLDTFQNLLNKLEGSKKRQKRQESVEGRRDIYATDLAGMMSNF